MKSLRPEDRMKAVVLALLVVAVFAMVGWRFQSSLNQSAPPPAADDHTIGTANTVSLGGSDSSAPKALEPSVEFSPPTAAPHKDPFRVVERPQKSQPVEPPPTAMPPMNTGDPENAPFAPMKGDITAAPSDPAASKDSARLPKVGDSAIESIKVQGVITGDQGVAVLKVGENQFVVKQGDLFGEGYRLQSVTTTQVVITRGTQTRTLVVGAG